MSLAASSVSVRVRAATEEDVPLLRDLITELATFEGYPDGPRLSVDELLRDGFSSSPAWYFALIAEEVMSGEALGYALCSRAYSSWTGRALYVEDLYVRAGRRRRGVGRALLKRIAQLGMAEGVTRVDWHVLESNARALAFYARLGARDMRLSEGRAAMRWDEERIRALADAPDGEWPQL